MGCTSSKPKRTTSIEDVASKPHEQPVPDKNGQVTKAPAQDKLLREKEQGKESKAIEIPGAHRSFMAPDGIPFIDEDVESELDEAAVVQPVNDTRNAKHGGSSPDQNKNVAIVANKEVKVVTATTVTTTKSSALKEDGGHEVETSRKETVTVSEPVVIAEVKIREVETTAAKNQEPTESSETRDRRTLTDDKEKTAEELAATKIQAGIRGYLDRQKVKAIRENTQHHHHQGHEGEGDGPHKDDDAQQHAGPKVTEHVVVETTEYTADDPHDPKLDAAATKIQANYKGYKTRKVIKTTTTTTTHSN